MIFRLPLLPTGLHNPGMNKTQLRKEIGIGTATLAKLSANEKVSLEVIEKICKALDCQPGDIMEYIPEKPD